MLRRVVFVAAVCYPNCEQCFMNGPGKCDDTHCNIGYNFVSDTNTCAGLWIYYTYHNTQ